MLDLTLAGGARQRAKGCSTAAFSRFLKLTAKGQPLDLTVTLSQAGLRDGNVVDAICLPVKLAATGSAFALYVQGGEVVTWGDPEYGGDSCQVQEQLRNVKQIHATATAFAAVLECGNVVTWVDPDSGGDSSQVQGQLTNVRQIQAAYAGAFAAILESELLSRGEIQGRVESRQQSFARAAEACPASPSNW